jgi:hypothetical protein
MAAENENTIKDSQITSAPARGKLRHYADSFREPLYPTLYFREEFDHL